MYHSSWAWALDTPFKSTKLVAAHFGGTRTPMVMSWPKADRNRRCLANQYSKNLKNTMTHHDTSIFIMLLYRKVTGSSMLNFILAYFCQLQWIETFFWASTNFNRPFFRPLAQVIEHDSTPRSQFHHVCDVAPTVYEAIGIKFPEHVEGVQQMPLDGVSMVSLGCGLKKCVIRRGFDGLRYTITLQSRHGKTW